jgi:quinol monooxygenase YgiN
MSITATLDLTITADSADSAHGLIHEVLEGTRAFPGNLGVDVIVDTENPLHIVLLERWESVEADTAYRTWRATEKGSSNLGSILAAAPTLTVFEVADGV